MGLCQISQSPRSDAPGRLGAAPVETAGHPASTNGQPGRRSRPAVEFGLGFGRIDEATRERDLRRMKRLATGLLLAATVVFLLARWWEVNDGPAWIGYVRATAEAGMVGALADWFAVTALFRRPLGLPIPHTAIIPTKKDALGDSLGDFVGENFLAEDVVRDKLAPGRGGHRGSAAGSASRPTPTGSPPSWPPLLAAWSPCCATTTCRR